MVEWLQCCLTGFKTLCREAEWGHPLPPEVSTKLASRMEDCHSDLFSYIMGVLRTLLCPISLACAHKCVFGGCRRIPAGTRSPPHTPPHSAVGQKWWSNGAGRKTRMYHTAWWQDRWSLQRERRGSWWKDSGVLRICFIQNSGEAEAAVWLFWT